MLLIACGGPSVLRADVVRLRDGGEIRGVIRSPGAGTRKAPHSPPTTVETLAGTEIVVSDSEIHFVTKRPRIVEEYENAARRVANTVQARWQLAEWCRQHGLAEPRKEQLQHILELDPEHKQARYGLGHRRVGNRWLSPEEENAELLQAGYVRHKGKVISLLELERQTASESRRDQQNQWRPKIRLWHGWLTGRDTGKQGNALAKFRGLRDPDSIPAVADLLLADANALVRRVGLETVSQMEGDAVTATLTRVALRDADQTLRSLAFESLNETQRRTAVGIFERALKDDANVVVLRAAVLLGRLGARSSIPALIEALTTSHQVRVPVQQGIMAGFRRDGVPSTPTGLPLEIEGALRTGQLPYGVSVQQAGGPQPSVKWVTVRRSQQNLEVLDALRKLTDQDFSYDKRAWRLWWDTQR